MVFSGTELPKKSVCMDLLRDTSLNHTSLPTFFFFSYSMVTNTVTCVFQLRTRSSSVRYPLRLTALQCDLTNKKFQVKNSLQSQAKADG